MWRPVTRPVTPSSTTSAAADAGRDRRNPRAPPRSARRACPRCRTSARRGRSPRRSSRRRSPGEEADTDRRAAPPARRTDSNRSPPPRRGSGRSESAGRDRRRHGQEPVWPLHVSEAGDERHDQVIGIEVQRASRLVAGRQRGECDARRHHHVLVGPADPGVEEVITDLGRRRRRGGRAPGQQPFAHHERLRRPRREVAAEVVAVEGAHRDRHPGRPGRQTVRAPRPWWCGCARSAAATARMARRSSTSALMSLVGFGSRPSPRTRWTARSGARRRT